MHDQTDSSLEHKPAPGLESMPGLPSHLYKRLNTALLDCAQFDSDKELRAIFVAESLKPWQQALPESGSRVSRVQTVIDFLYGQYSHTHDNALVLLLRVLSDLTDPASALHHTLADLADELQPHIQASGMEKVDEGVDVPRVPLKSLRRVRLLLAGMRSDLTVERQNLLLDTLAASLETTRADLMITVLDHKVPQITLQVPEDAAMKLCESGAEELLRTIETRFTERARELGVTPHHCRIVSVHFDDPDKPAYTLEFANREHQRQHLLSPGASRYIEIVAPAGYGKTYLFNQLKKDFAAEGWQPVGVNFGEPDTPQTEAELLAAFAEQLHSSDIEMIDDLTAHIFGERLSVVFLFDGTEHASSFFKEWLVDDFLPQVEEDVLPPVKAPRVIAAGRRRVTEWNQFGRPRFEPMTLLPFHAGVIETVLRQQIDKRADLKASPERNWYRDIAPEIFEVTKGHPLCICNVMQWLDANNFARSVGRFRRMRGEIFVEQVRPVIEEQTLRHLPDYDLLHLVHFFCVLRDYNFNIIRWLAGKALEATELPQALRDIFADVLQRPMGPMTAFRQLSASQLDDGSSVPKFDMMIRQLISLQVELEMPELFWQIQHWAVEMYEYWIAGMDQTDTPLPTPPSDETQARYMVEALYHHARLMDYRKLRQAEATRELAECVQRYCEQARSATGWNGQTIQQFIELVQRDDELIYYLEIVIGKRSLDDVMDCAYEAVR